MTDRCAPFEKSSGGKELSFGLTQSVEKMTVDRFYIYRSGKTNACALTREKSDSHLPPNGWQFWMQASNYQSEDDRYGFNWKIAVTEIATTGYYLFTGSKALLDPRAFAPAAAGRTNV
jgi:hypothetical protein